MRVVAGLIQNDIGEYLVAKRSSVMSHSGKWEFPGGKVESAETDEAAIIRELLEELGIRVRPQSTVGEFLDTQARPQILLIGMRCIIEHGQPKPIEHAALRWVSPQGLRTMDMCRSDIALLDLI